MLSRPVLTLSSHASLLFKLS